MEKCYTFQIRKWKEEEGFDDGRKNFGVISHI